MNKLNIAVVTASRINRTHLADAVEGTELAQVVQFASQGTAVLEKLASSPMDVVLLAGAPHPKETIDALTAISDNYPSVHLVLAVRDTERDSMVQLNPLEKAGALDFILLPHETNTLKYYQGLRHRLHGIFTEIITSKYTSSTRKKRPPKQQTVRPVPAQKEQNSTSTRIRLQSAEIVVIAASTGGPAALDTIVRQLPSDFNKPILVVQHIPTQFAKNLAQSLNKVSSLPVVEAHEGDPLNPGHVMIAPGGLHLTVAVQRGERLVKLLDTPPVNGVRPAADVLFESVAAAYAGKNVLAVILTGMGIDGTHGVKALKYSCNCCCLAQSENSCAVYGMPKSAVNAGLVDQIKDPDEIAQEITKLGSVRMRKSEC